MVSRSGPGSSAALRYDPLVWFEGAGVADAARRYLLAEERGSIIAVSDGNANKLAINAYDEWGNPDDGSQASLATKGRFRYTGQTLIPELGMYYYKARMYSPTLGRFMQTDPIGYEDQVTSMAMSQTIRSMASIRRGNPVRLATLAIAEHIVIATIRRMMVRQSSLPAKGQVAASPSVT